MFAVQSFVRSTGTMICRSFSLGRDDSSAGLKSDKALFSTSTLLCIIRSYFYMAVYARAQQSTTPGLTKAERPLFPNIDCDTLTVPHLVSNNHSCRFGAF